MAHENPRDPGAFKKVLLKNEELSRGSIRMINWAKIPVGRSFQAHYHHDMVEIFILLFGKISVTVDNETTSLEKGDVVVIPEKHKHAMKNTGKVTAEYIVIGVKSDSAGRSPIP